MTQRRAAVWAPGLFVVLWSTGFIGAKLGVPYVEPFTFLVLRFIFVLALMLPLALLVRARWPAVVARNRPHRGGRRADSGRLSRRLLCRGRARHARRRHRAGGRTAAHPDGVRGGTAARRNRVAVQWAGLVLGFGGVALVVWQKISLQGLDAASITWSLVSLISITAGTLYQKRFCASFDLRAGSVIQFGAGLLLLLPLALTTETMQVNWSGEFVFALAWLVLVLSIGAISLLFTLIEHGEATRVASLFYLTPLTTAAMAWFMFGEKLAPAALIGMVIGVIGVALVVRKPGLATPEP